MVVNSVAPFVPCRRAQSVSHEPLRRQGSSTTSRPPQPLSAQAIKHIWVRTALFEKVLDKIVQYIVDNSRWLVSFFPPRQWLSTPPRALLWLNDEQSPGITYSVSIILLWSLGPAWPAASVCSNKLFTLAASAGAKWCIDTPPSEASNMKCPHRYVTARSAVLVIVDIGAKIESLALRSDDSSDWSHPILISGTMSVAGKILCATRLWIYLWEEKLVQRTSCPIGCRFVQA